MFFPKDLAAQYLRKHGYNIIDRGAMPFRYGITTIDFVAYEKSKDTLVAVRLYAMDDTYDNVMSEWRHKDSPYFRRAIRRYGEKSGWRGNTRADLIWVRDNNEILHVIGEVKGGKKKMSNNWIMRTWKLLDPMDSFLSTPIRVKPMNTRTRKTIWKERRRRANLPRSIKRRGGAK